MIEQSKPWVLLLASMVFFGLVTTTAYYKENGFRDVQKLMDAIKTVQGQLEEMKMANERGVMEIASLKNSDFYVESIARDSLGLVKPGETVYEFVEATRMTAPAETPKRAIAK